MQYIMTAKFIRTKNVQKPISYDPVTLGVGNTKTETIAAALSTWDSYGGKFTPVAIYTLLRKGEISNYIDGIHYTLKLEYGD